jgi:hypothetical protein
LSQVGFEMKSSKGESLVCHSEIDYQNSWSLTMYGALDRQPCPRNAQGKLHYCIALSLLNCSSARGPVTVVSYLSSVTTGGNQSTRRKPPVWKHSSHMVGNYNRTTVYLADQIPVIEGKGRGTNHRASNTLLYHCVGREVSIPHREVTFLCCIELDYSSNTLFHFIIGECSRRCLGSENETVEWDVPNFSGCTSLEFRNLHEKVRLNSSPR